MDLCDALPQKDKCPTHTSSTRHSRITLSDFTVGVLYRRKNEGSKHENHVIWVPVSRAARCCEPNHWYFILEQFQLCCTDVCFLDSVGVLWFGHPGPPGRLSSKY